MCTGIRDQNEKSALLRDSLKELCQRYGIQADYHYDRYKHKQRVVCHINPVSRLDRSWRMGADVIFHRIPGVLDCLLHIFSGKIRIFLKAKAWDM